MSISTETNDRPRSLRDADERQRRKALLSQCHMAPLTRFATTLRELNLGQVPDFDPLDGGVEARVLFLFEKPGPMTAEAGKRAGSGFISRNNDDGTAAATFDFMCRAGIDRKLTIIWNVVPWWNGTRKITAKELKAGVECVQELITLLPMLSAVVIVGAKAAKAERLLNTRGLSLFRSCHPSPIVRASMRDRWDLIPTEWGKVRSVLDGE